MLMIVAPTRQQFMLRLIDYSQILSMALFTAVPDQYNSKQYFRVLRLDNLIPIIPSAVSDDIFDDLSFREFSSPSGFMREEVTSLFIKNAINYIIYLAFIGAIGIAVKMYQRSKNSTSHQINYIIENIMLVPMYLMFQDSILYIAL